MSKILAGGDDESISYLVKLTLLRENYIVETASTGIEIKNKLTTFKPDLLVLYINLSGDDGREIYREIKSSNKKIKVIDVCKYKNAGKL